MDYTLNTLKETISSLGNYNEPVNRIVDLADKQIQESMIMLHKEQQDFDIKHKTVVSSLENELEKMMKDYVGEISAGRVWVQEERDRLESERRAFQEEQQHILGEIEKQKELLDQLRVNTTLLFSYILHCFRLTSSLKNMISLSELSMKELLLMKNVDCSNAKETLTSTE